MTSAFFVTDRKFKLDVLFESQSVKALTKIRIFHAITMVKNLNKYYDS